MIEKTIDVPSQKGSNNTQTVVQVDSKVGLLLLVVVALSVASIAVSLTTSTTTGHVIGTALTECRLMMNKVQYYRRELEKLNLIEIDEKGQSKLVNKNE